MVFDRRKAHGMRLNIPAGTATRFEVESLALIISDIYNDLFY